MENPQDPADIARREQRDQDVRAFADRWLPGRDQDLYEGMLVTLTRMARDDANRGDVKLLNKAIAELRFAFKVFAPYASIRKISVFGSARTPEDHPNYVAALEFSRKVCESGWMVITGAGDGIMKAGHGGAGREKSFGVAIRLPFEQKTNSIIEADPKLINFRYFFTRKLMFMKEAAAVALFPGGFGTQDEGFEALTLIQTGKMPLVPIVMIEHPGGTYWPHWRTWVERELLCAGLISEHDTELFLITDDIDCAVREVVQFYRVYHSMRFVGKDLVLRLERDISDATLRTLNAEFRGLLDGGGIERTAPLADEEGELPDKARLKLQFDRRSCGLLRRMINVINLDGA